MNENYKDFVTIYIFLFQSSRSQAAEGRLRGKKGMIKAYLDEKSIEYHVKMTDTGSEARPKLAG